MLCLIGQSNWIGDYSLMTLLWLVNNVMIKVLHTWQRNRSYRSNVFNLDTNKLLLRWSLLFCCYFSDNRELCFNVTCQFCIGVSRTTDYAHVIINYDTHYYQKPASVNAFSKTCLASKFPCLLNFAAAAFQLWVHVRNNDGCPPVNSGLWFDWKKGPIVSRTSGWKLGNFLNFVNISNKLTLVCQSQ